MYVCCQRDEHANAVEIVATIIEFKEIGEKLLQLANNISFQSDRNSDTAYPEILEYLVFEIAKENQQDGMIHLAVTSNTLYLRATPAKIKFLGENFINFYESDCESRFHWHIDHWDGSGNLAPTDFSLIIAVK